MGSKTIPLTISMPREFQEWINAKRKQGFVLSKLIVQMIRESIEKEKAK